ncbi:zinc-binding dehydrogenase [Microthyrium microscopicum]|uniref:Zinc-binding dehydrogenase n=1 Tax=Microthyrium microscopicum TaxID=703497 RepID=A0A6A6TYB3_9PEZI|nr:zinc-binding dehydrogenase [Microthyrium microscopicum]
MLSESKQNDAAWLVAKGKSIEIKTAPYTKPGPNQILIQSHAVAINPIDRIIQDLGNMAFSWIKFPTIVGSDVAGSVLSVGSNVQRFKPGDRVVGFGLGFTQGKSDPTQAAFQEYVLLREDLCAPMPAIMSYEQACVIPLGLSTAASGLYQKKYLNLALPSINIKNTGKTILIWGGSTSVGANAIQLARASGYEVFTTCSPRNYDFVKRLGASQAFDYNSATVAADIIRAFEDKDCAGALSMGSGSAEKCCDILGSLKKANKFVAMASFPGQKDGAPNGPLEMASMLTGMLTANSKIWWKSRTKGLKTNFIFGSDLEENEVGPAVWKSFLGDALAQGTFIPSPEPLVVPTRGLKGIQEGFDMQKKGVSAKKVVVIF